MLNHLIFETLIAAAVVADSPNPNCCCCCSLLALSLVLRPLPSWPFCTSRFLVAPSTMAAQAVVESSDERRARLRALRAAQELSAPDAPEQGPPSNGQHLAPPAPAQEHDNDDGQEDAEMKFRNYFPRDSDLQKAKHPPPVIPKFEDPVATDPLQVAGAEDPIVTIAPKKPNWDLRRDVAKKLEKLERRTQRAIVELMIEEEERRQAEAADNLEQD